LPCLHIPTGIYLHDEHSLGDLCGFLRYTLILHYSELICPPRLALSSSRSWLHSHGLLARVSPAVYPWSTLTVQQFKHRTRLEPGANGSPVQTSNLPGSLQTWTCAHWCDSSNIELELSRADSSLYTVVCLEYLIGVVSLNCCLPVFYIKFARDVCQSHPLSVFVLLFIYRLAPQKTGSVCYVCYLRSTCAH
jgi:hypothetical protein